MEPAEDVVQSNSPSTQAYHFTSTTVHFIDLSLFEGGHQDPHRPSIREHRLIAGRYFFNYTSGADGGRLGLPVKISVLATVLALATALGGMAVALRGEGEQSRDVHVIDAAVAVSSIVALTSLCWMLLDDGYRWIACWELSSQFASSTVHFWVGSAKWFRYGSRAGHGSFLPR
uniref:ERAD-associated E3 ubiquitin-protein ligase DOA10 n=1 Tax=Anthurium amnicola TaxID=1678845 RepID=A0A1D1YR30_9ARAE